MNINVIYTISVYYIIDVLVVSVYHRRHPICQRLSFSHNGKSIIRFSLAGRVDEGESCICWGVSLVDGLVKQRK
jgi:hypothetical protein